MPQCLPKAERVESSATAISQLLFAGSKEFKGCFNRRSYRHALAALQSYQFSFKGQGV